MKAQFRYIVFTLLALAGCVSAFAHDFEVRSADGVTIYYNKLSDNTCEVTYKSKNSDGATKKYKGKVVIPTTVTDKGLTYSVVSIGGFSFSDCSSLTSINIPEGVASIGKYAFSNCTSLTSINIPESVTSIGGFAFYKCSSLTSINFPEGVTSIGESTFFDCSSLMSINISKGVTSIEAWAFGGCSSLMNINIPEGVTSIGEYAFAKCSSLTSINIPEGAVSIKKGTFYNCSSLTSINIPKGVTSIGVYSFYSCPKLKTVIYADGLTEQKAKELYAWGADVKFHKEDIKPTFDPNAFPIINISDIAFTDNGNKRIDAGERCIVKMKVTNTGKGAAAGCVAKAKINGAAGVTAQDVKIPTIASGQTVEVVVELQADATIKDGKAEISVSVDEPNGFGCDPTLLMVETKAFEAPKVQIVDYSVTSAQGGTLAKRIPFDLQVLLQNAAQGTADDVDVIITVPQNVFLMEGEQKAHFNQLGGGATQSMVYSLIVNNNYSGSTIPVQFTLKEKHGKYAENRTINLTLNQSFAQNKIEIQGEVAAPQGNISIAMIAGDTSQADVDINIPQNAVMNQNTFAVVIANENYRRETAVKFAANDGRVMQQYLTQTLGLPASNVHVAVDATLNEMSEQIDWLRQVAQAYNGEASVIFYYAGHGMPDEQTGTAYLIPTDGNSAKPSTCIALKKLYDELACMNIKRACVFIDACFSGAQRGEGMLMAARGVGIKPKKDALSGNLVVFSAAQGAETAYPYTEMGHGLFTYYLLKKWQDTKGDVLLGDLSEYITSEVSRRSIVVNSKLQTPSTAGSVSLGDAWKTWKLK